MIIIVVIGLMLLSAVIGVISNRRGSRPPGVSQSRRNAAEACRRRSQQQSDVTRPSGGFVPRGWSNGAAGPHLVEGRKGRNRIARRRSEPNGQSAQPD